MKNTMLILFALSSFLVKAQNDQKDIDEQVWKPFTRAIMSQDVEAFIQVHSKDLIRAERDSKKVVDLTNYQKVMVENWPRWKEDITKNKIQYTFELRFTERISNGTQAFEVGYFKNESFNLSGEKRVSYGKFQVALRKENGTWKILVDSDSNEGRTITEKDFLAAKPME
jgi:ketosteroid isomerase-like protein